MFKSRRQRDREENERRPSAAPIPTESSMEGPPLSGDDVASAESLGETTVLTVSVDRVNANAAAALYEVVLEFTASGQRHFVLDMQNVTYIDSACLGVLLRLLRDLQEMSGRIALANVNPYVASLFRITRLDRAFPICRDTMAALSAVERAA